MIIKDRLIEVDIAEALAIAGKGEEVRCVGEGTGLMTIADALDGLTFFAPESALTEPDTLKVEFDPDEAEKFEKEIAKLGVTTLAPVMTHFDTPENRTRAILDRVERYDKEHGDPPVTRQDEEAPKCKVSMAEAPKAEGPKAEALAKEYSGEVPGFVPFAGALTRRALKK